MDLCTLSGRCSLFFVDFTLKVDRQLRNLFKMAFLLDISDRFTMFPTDLDHFDHGQGTEIFRL